MPLLSKVNAGNSRVANSRVSSIFAKKVSQKIKRAGPSHKPHPKATCPHPTRPLRPPGRRAREDYAQLMGRMQQKVKCFFFSLCSLFEIRWLPIHFAFKSSFPDKRGNRLDAVKQNYYL